MSLCHRWDVRDRAGNPALTRLADSHLLGLIEPDDIASTALYLASDESRILPLLAALTPSAHSVTLVDENVEAIDFERCAQADIVGLTGMNV
jgi:hypothetical protein